MNSDLQNGALAGAVAACDAIGAAMLTRLTSRLGEDSGASGNVLACPVGLALALATLRAGAADNGTGIDAMLGVNVDGNTQGRVRTWSTIQRNLQRLSITNNQARDRVWSAVQRGLRRFDVADAQQLRDFDPEAIPETPLLHIANNILAIGDKTVINQEYLDSAKRWYASDLGRVPVDDAKAALDAWANLHTGGLIKESGIDIDPSMRLVAQNALLFAARWAVPFKAEDTRQGASFTLADGSASTADLMTGTGSYTLVTGKGWRALRLPYSAGPESTATASGSDSSSSSNLVMDIILPDAIGSPADLPSATWGEATTALTAAASQSQQQVALKLPKLDLASGVMDIRPVLQSLGVKTLMLDHISPGLDVDQAVQQVRLIVAEEGTVAAALTEVGGDGAPADDASRPVEFVVDHPYVLRIVDLASGAVVIEAAILNPTEG